MTAGNKVIVLDGNTRPALAITRSLGKRGIDVIVGEISSTSLAGSSKYSKESFCYESPESSPEKFIEDIIANCKKYPGCMLFPVTDLSLSEILMNKDKFGEEVIIPFTDYDNYLSVTDKDNLFRSAIELGIAIPDTIFSKDYETRDDFIKAACSFGFPVVVKPFRSGVRQGISWVSEGVQYAGDEEQLKLIINTGYFSNHPFILQKLVRGPGLGAFYLAEKGRIKASFFHKRIREKPPWGGVSVLSESIPGSVQINEFSEKIISRSNWDGIIMVEYKLDKADNVPKLMEVNARFWGSLQLAVSSGVDFPFLLYSHANNSLADQSGGYSLGVKSRWELGDLDCLYLVLKGRWPIPRELTDTPSVPVFFLRYFVDFIKPSVNNEMLRFNDPGPFFCELKEYIKTVCKR